MSHIHRINFNRKDSGYYDGMNQLIALQRENNARERFHYDATGNWKLHLQDTDGNGVWDIDQARTHNQANEITSIQDLNPVNHDRNGNMTRVPQPESWPSTFTLTYDAWNRLVSVKDGATTVADYTYDARNRRVKKITPTETREFYYNRNWQCLEEYVANIQATQYLWGIRYVGTMCSSRINLATFFRVMPK